MSQSLLARICAKSTTDIMLRVADKTELPASYH